MSTGIVRSEKLSPNSVNVLWTIGKSGKKLEENCILKSVPFYFAGHMWQPLLKTVDTLDYSPISFSILRITISIDETPNSHVVLWNMGIVRGIGRRYHYGRTGCASLAMVSEWVTVADFEGPLLKDLCLEKHMYMPDDEISIAVRLILDSSDTLINVEQDRTPILKQSSIISDVVVVNVKDQTFYAEGSILDGISNDIELKTSEVITGKMTVIDLPDCDPDAFEWFLSFKESGEVEGLTDSIAREVYDIADKFQVPELKSECVQRFLRNLDVSSVTGFLEMAERYDDRELKEECSKFFLKNAREILNTSGWLEFVAKRTKFANELIISYLDSIA